MGGEAVDLDHDLLCTPEEVDLESLDASVAFGLGKAGGADQRAEAPLGFLARDRGARVVTDQGGQPAGAPAPRGSLEHVTEVAIANEFEDARLVECTVEVTV